MFEINHTLSRRAEWKAGLCSAIIVVPATILYWQALATAWVFPPEPHSAINKAATAASLIAMLPGVILEVARAMIFSGGGGHGMDEKSVLIPLGSFGFYFLVFLPIFRWFARRASRRQLRETPRTT